MSQQDPEVALARTLLKGVREALRDDEPPQSVIRTCADSAAQLTAAAASGKKGNIWYTAQHSTAQHSTVRVRVQYTVYSIYIWIWIWIRSVM